MADLDRVRVRVLDGDGVSVRVRVGLPEPEGEADSDASKSTTTTCTLSTVTDPLNNGSEEVVVCTMAPTHPAPLPADSSVTVYTLAQLAAGMVMGAGVDRYGATQVPVKVKVTTTGPDGAAVRLRV